MSDTFGSEVSQLYRELENLNISSELDHEETRMIHELKINSVHNITQLQIAEIGVDLDAVMRKLRKFKKKPITELILEAEERIIREMEVITSPPLMACTQLSLLSLYDFRTN